MRFLERFRKSENGQTHPIEEADASNLVPSENRTQREERLRLESLNNSLVPNVINQLSQLPEVEVLNPSTWYPTVCVLDTNHRGDKPKYDCFDVVGRPDGSVLIGTELLSKKDAKEQELVDHAFLKAHDNAVAIFGDPRASVNS